MFATLASPQPSPPPQLSRGAFLSCPYLGAAGASRRRFLFRFQEMRIRSGAATTDSPTLAVVFAAAKKEEEDEEGPRRETARLFNIRDDGYCEDGK